MDVISISMLAVTGFFVLFGFCFGVKRGLNRSLLRLITIVLAVIFAYAARNMITERIMDYQIEGQTVEQLVMSYIPQEMSSISPYIFLVLKIIVGLIVFVMAFFVLKIASWFLYVILTIFVRPGKHKMGLFGGIVGVVQGVLISLVVCIPLSGLCLETGKLASIEIDGTKVVDFGENANYLSEYENSSIGQAYQRYGSSIFVSLTSVKNDNGNTVTLSGQVNAIVALSSLTNEVKMISNIDFSEGLTAQNISELKELCANIDNIKDNIGEEEIETINAIITTAAESFDLPIDVSDLDMSEVDISNEALIVESIYDYTQTGEVDNVSEVVASLADSKLVLPALDAADLKVTLDDDKKAEVEAAINSLEGKDEATINSLKKLFGFAITE